MKVQKREVTDELVKGLRINSRLQTQVNAPSTTQSLVHSWLSTNIYQINEIRAQCWCSLNKIIAWDTAMVHILGFPPAELKSR